MIFPSKSSHFNKGKATLTFARATKCHAPRVIIFSFHFPNRAHKSFIMSLSTSVDLRTVYAFAREFHQKCSTLGSFSYGELAI